MRDIKMIKKPQKLPRSAQTAGFFDVSLVPRAKPQSSPRKSSLDVRKTKVIREEPGQAPVPTRKPTPSEGFRFVAKSAKSPAPEPVVEQKKETKIVPSVLPPQQDEEGQKPDRFIKRSVPDDFWPSQKEIQKIHPPVSQPQIPPLFEQDDKTTPKDPLPETAARYPGKATGRLFKRSVLGFSVAVILLTSSVGALALFQDGRETKDKVFSEAQTAYGYLNSAQGSISGADFAGARENFQKATDHFQQAEANLGSFGLLASATGALLPGQNQLTAGQHLLNAGRSTAEAGELLAVGLEPFAESSLIWKQLLPQESEAADQNELALNIAAARDSLVLAAEKVAEAEAEVNQVDPGSLPPEIASQVEEFRNKIPALTGTLEQVVMLSDMLVALLGQQEEKRYLMLFANNREIRAGGGFIGSYAEVVLKPEKSNRFTLQEIYALDGQLKEAVKPPRPLRFLVKKWYMRDANWFANYPDSARKVEWFFERSGGHTIDGVISLTPTFIEEILRVTGPLEMTQYGVTLDHNNFFQETEFRVEQAYEPGVTPPKQFLTDMAPVLFERLAQLEPAKWLEVLQTMITGLNQKQMVMYFNNPELQDIASQRGWAGEIKETPKDYLAIIDSNIGGRKSDHQVKQRIEHRAVVQADGSIVDELTINRQHTGEGEWYSGINFDYLRVFVPQGSELLEATGFNPGEVPYHEIDDTTENDSDLERIESAARVDTESGTLIMNESGKTVFGNWIKLEPGQNNTITMRYRLPFKLDLDGKLAQADSYSLLAQKQVGDYNHYLRSVLELPEGFAIAWVFPEDPDIQGRLFEYQTLFNQDKYYAVTITDNR